MKNIVDSFIRFLINSVIILVIVGLGIIAFVIVLSKTGNIALEENISYVQSFKPENTTSVVSTLPKKEIVNMQSGSLSNNTSLSNTSGTTQEKSFYYYQQLDSNGKLIYDTLYQNIPNLKKENYVIDFGKQFNTLLNQPSGQIRLNQSFQSALDAFFYDHPELFYLELTKITMFMKYTTIGPITTYTVSLVPENNGNYLNSYFFNEVKTDAAIHKVEDVRNSILKKVSTNDSDYEKVKIVHDSLVKMLEYESSRANIHNIYGSLVEKKAVCEGYAKAFKYILDSLDIPCILVCGMATNSNSQTENHMWNYVQLNGIWYGVDVTWDDPIIIGGNSNSSTIRHTYFCKGNSTFSRSHIPSGSISNEGQIFKLPTLASKNY